MTQKQSGPENNTPNQPNDTSDSKGSKKNEKKKTSTAFWVLLIGGVLVAVILTSFASDMSSESMKLSEFKSKLSSGKFDSKNVHEVVFKITSITFQNMSKQEVLDQADAKKKSDKKDTSHDQADASNASKELQGYRINTVGIPSQTLASLMEDLESRQIDYSGSPPPAEIESMLYLLMLVIFVLFFIMMFRRMGGAGGAMAFGRSRGKLVSEDDPKTTFNDIAGIDEAVCELREIVEFLKTPAKYQALGARIPRGVLLVGPPGTGKTLLAKAVAGEAGVPFFGLSGSDFVEMFVGVGAARVRDTFKQATERAPSIIFIDELDALGKTRGSGMPGGHDEREQTLNALLVEMDGFSSDHSVIVMGATNRPETLDPALMRPGRFDRNVLVDNPDYKGREAILKLHAAKIKMDEHVNLLHIAKLTPGFSGADLANLANEAALLAARNDRKSVSMAEFEDAIERVVVGLEKSSRIIGEDIKLRVAYHECGHALVASCLPNTDPVHKISIIPRGFGALGYMLQRPQDDRFLITQSELENRICMMLGGLGAERVIYNEQSTGAQNDLERASDTARRMVTEFGMSPQMGTVNYQTQRRSPFMEAGIGGSASYEHSQDTLREIDQEVKRIVDECLATVMELLQKSKDVLEHMTRDLVEMEVMDSDHLETILKQYKTGPQIKPGTQAATAETTPQQPSEPKADSEQATDEDSATGA